MMINTNLIKKLLKEKNMTIYRLAKITSIDETGLRNIINGKRKDPHISTIAKIAKSLDVKVDDLLLEKEKMMKVISRKG